MTKTDVIDRVKKKKVVLFATEEDKQDAVDRAVFLGNLGYDASFELFEATVPDSEESNRRIRNLSLVKRICQLREKDDCTVYVVSPCLDIYFEFLAVPRVKRFSDFIVECPMRVIYMGEVTKKEILKYVESEGTSEDCIMKNLCEGITKVEPLTVNDILHIGGKGKYADKQ